MSTYKTTRTGAKRCPRCYFVHDAMTHSLGDGDGTPKEGDLAICSRCREVNQLCSRRIGSVAPALVPADDLREIKAAAAAEGCAA